MSIKPQYETYRYTGEICNLTAQSMVECRLPGSEIGSVLAVHARAVGGECVCADGEVRYGGKLVICIVYEDGNRKICRAERGAEFFHKAENSAVTPACFAKILLTPDNVSTRREGSGAKRRNILSVATGFARKNNRSPFVRAFAYRGKRKRKTSLKRIRSATWYCTVKTRS